MHERCSHTSLPVITPASIIFPRQRRSWQMMTIDVRSTLVCYISYTTPVIFACQRHTRLRQMSVIMKDVRSPAHDYRIVDTSPIIFARQRCARHQLPLTSLHMLNPSYRSHIGNSVITFKSMMERLSRILLG